jgi:hypothetical protein
MRFLAALGLAMFPFAAAAWSALHWQALGAEGGVLWCIAFLAVVIAVCVVGAHLEARADG